MLTEALPAGAFAFMLMFARLGAIAMVLPGIGEMYVPAPVRLAFALAFTLALTPVVAPLLPPAPPSLLRAAALVMGEVLIGVAVGFIARFLLTALQVAGAVISAQSGIGAATFFDPMGAGQSAVFGNFLTLIGVTALFAADLHLVLLRAAADSYLVFPTGAPLPAGDAASHVTDLVTQAFRIGVQISAPFIVFGLVFNVGMGLLNRLMPTLQVFFVMAPIQMVLSFLLFIAIVGAGTAWFLEHYEAAVATLLAR